MLAHAHEKQQPGSKAVTVRLPDQALAELGALEIIDQSTMAGELRAAVDHYAKQRLASPDFPEQVAEARRRQLAALAVFEPYISQQ